MQGNVPLDYGSAHQEDHGKSTEAKDTAKEDRQVKWCSKKYKVLLRENSNTPQFSNFQGKKTLKTCLKHFNDLN